MDAELINNFLAIMLSIIIWTDGWTDWLFHRLLLTWEL